MAEGDSISMNYLENVNTTDLVEMLGDAASLSEMLSAPFGSKSGRWQEGMMMDWSKKHTQLLTLFTMLFFLQMKENGSNVAYMPMENRLKSVKFALLKVFFY